MTVLTAGSALGWAVMAVGLWVLLLRGGEDQVADVVDDGVPLGLVGVGVLTVLVLVGLLGSLWCAARLAAGPVPSALLTAGGGVLLVVVVATGGLVAQGAVVAQVAAATRVPAPAPPATVVAIVLTMVLAVAGVGVTLLGTRRARSGAARP